MSTVAQLIDRVLRDWLEQADDQPTRATLDGTITDVATSLVYDPALLSPEEIDIIGPGTLIEIDSEELLVGAIDEDTNTLSGLTRGVNGTTAAAHNAGAFIYPHRTWRRKVIFDALCDGVVQLWPDLYRVTNSASLAVSSTTYTEVPAADATYIVAPMWFFGRMSGAAYYDRYEIPQDLFLDPFPGSSTSKAFFVPGASVGLTGYLTYKAKFARPTAEADDLSAGNFSLNPEWEQLVILSAVAYLIAGREFDLATQERLSEQLEEANYPAGTPSRIRDSILRYRSFLLDQAKADLRTRWAVTVSNMTVL